MGHYKGSISLCNDRLGFGATTGDCPYQVGKLAKVKCIHYKPNFAVNFGGKISIFRGALLRYLRQI
jgi:hypothetical protein